MVIKIKAKSAESAPRILLINQKPVYNLDRRDGFRLTVFDRETFKIMSDANFDTFSEAYTTFMKYYNIPGYIGVINGHGEGNVLVAIIDANTQNKLLKKGKKEVYAEYIVSIRAPEEALKKGIEEEEKSAKKAAPPELIEEHKGEQLTKNLFYLMLLLIGGIIFLKVIKE